MPNRTLLPGLLLLFSLFAISACGNDDAQQTQTAPESSPPAVTESTSAPSVPPADTIAVEPVETTVMPEPVIELATEEMTETVAPVNEPAPAAEPMPAAEEVVTETPVETATETTVKEETTTPVTTAPIDGGQLYNTYCAICHRAGMNAAPKFGSKPLWAKRIAQGRETVYSHAINGLRGMPPRGGFAQLTDDEIKAATDYMVNASGGWGK